MKAFKINLIPISVILPQEQKLHKRFIKKHISNNQ